MLVTPFLHAAKRAPSAATAPTMYDVVNDFAKHTAMTAIAPRSSTVASVSKNAATPPGILFLKKLYTPIANAMSVAMGMAQPAVTAAAAVDYYTPGTYPSAQSSHRAHRCTATPPVSNFAATRARIPA